MKTIFFMFLNKWYLILVMLSLLPTFRFSLESKIPQVFINQVYASTITKERYDDFYNRKMLLKRDDEARERGRLKYKELKKKDALQAELIEKKFAKVKKEVDQEKQDQIAQKWMEQQDRLHQEALNRAGEKYISKKKTGLKYKIPEYEEFDVR